MGAIEKKFPWQKKLIPQLLVLEPRILFDGAAAATPVADKPPAPTPDASSANSTVTDSNTPSTNADAGPLLSSEAGILLSTKMDQQVSQTPDSVQQVLFVDTRSGAAPIFDQAPKSTVDVVWLDPNADAFQTISDYMASHHNIISMALMGGLDGDGVFSLGDSSLDVASVDDHFAQISQWQNGLTGSLKIDLVQPENVDLSTVRDELQTLTPAAVFTTDLSVEQNAVWHLVSENSSSASSNAVSELVFIDSSIANVNQLADLSRSGVEIVFLNPSEDGLTQIAAISAHYSSLDAIHIVTNSNGSYAELATTEFSVDNLSSRSVDIAQISQSVKDIGVIDFYAADSASYLADNLFINKLATFSGGTGQLEAQRLVAADSTQDAGKHEIVFIDSNLKNWQQLVTAVNPGLEVVLINGQGDGFREMADYLAGQSQIDAVHIVSHGSQGELFFGALDVTANNVASYTQDLAAIGSVLVPGGDILFYGCDVGQGALGEAFLAQIATASGASVAASSDLTGPTTMGGNWVLETDIGQVLTPVAFDLAAVQAYSLDLGGSYNVTTGVNVDTSKATSGLIGAGKLITFDPIQITAGSVSAQLILNAYDVDYGLKDSSGNQYPIGNANSEWDGVYIAKYSGSLTAASGAIADTGNIGAWQFVGYLTGSNNTWNYTTFDINSFVSAQGSGKYLVQVVPDDNGTKTKANNGGKWVVGVASAQIAIDGGAQAARLSSITESAAAVSSTVTPTATGTYTVEYNLMDTAGHVVATTSKTMALTGGVGTSVAGTLAVNTNFYTSWASLPTGAYTLKVTLLDSSGTVQDTGTTSYTVVAANSVPTGTGIAAIVETISSGSWSGTSAADLMKTATTDTSPLILGSLTKIASASATSYVDIYVDGVFAGSASVAAGSTSWSFQFGDLSSGVGGTTSLLSVGAHVFRAVYTTAVPSISVEWGRTNSNAVAVAPNITLSTPNSAVPTGALVTLYGGTTGDTLTVSSSSIPAGYSVYSDAGRNNTISASSGLYTSTTGTLYIYKSSSATLSAFQAALRTVSYLSSDADPTVGGKNTSRLIKWQMNYSSGTYTAASTSTVQVYDPVNGTPALTSTKSGTTSTYYKSKGGVIINGDLRITDDSATMSTATVSIGSYQSSSGDVLSFSANASLYGAISGSWNSTSGVLTLTYSGSAPTIAQWNAALSSVKFNNTNAGVTAANRSISFAVNDGANSSSSATYTLAIDTTTSVPSVAPILTGGGNVLNVLLPRTSYPINPNITITDSDAPATSSIYQVTVKNSSTSSSGALALPSSSLYSSITGSYNSSTSTLTLTDSGGATLAQWQAALRAVTYSYSKTISTSSISTGTITFTAYDATTNALASNVSVTAFKRGGISGATQTGSGTSITIELGSGSLNQSTVYSSAAPAYTLLIDAPSTTKPVILAVDTQAGIHTTTDRTPSLSGTSAAGVSLAVYQGALLLGYTTADLSGQWSFAIPSGAPLTNASYSFSVIDQVQGGGSSTRASDAYALTVNSLAPELNITNIHISNDTAGASGSASDFITSVRNQTITATLSAALSGGMTLLGSVDGGITWVDVTNFVSGTTVTWTNASLTSGYYDPSNYVLNSIQFKAHNSSGDGATASQDYLLINGISDPVITSTSFLTSSTPSVNGTADPNSVVTISYVVSGITYRATTTPASDGTWVFTVPSPLANGSYTFTASAEDPISGATSSAHPTTTVTIDTTLPTVSAVTISADTAGASNSDKVTYTQSQTIGATISAALIGNQKLYASVNGGATWTDVTSFVNNTTRTLAWTNASLVSGVNEIDIQVRNSSTGATSNTAKLAYTLDMANPALTVGGAVIDTSTNIITLTFDDGVGTGLDSSVAPASSQFVITYGDPAVTISSSNYVVTIVDSSTLVITVSNTTFNPGESVDVAYTKPASGALLRDIAGNAVATFSVAVLDPAVAYSVADAAVAVEAGGNANASIGTNPSGSLLLNDLGPSLVVSLVEAGNLSSFSSPSTINLIGSTAIVGSYGTLDISGDGAYTYTVNNANSSVQALLLSTDTLTDIFTYQITDSGGAQSISTFTITINGVNDAPIAVSDTASAIEAGGTSNGTTGTNPSGNVLTNDTDVDAGDTKTVITVSGASGGTVGGSTVGNYGSLVLSSNGSYVFTVDNANSSVQALRTNGDTLTDVFSYTVKDTAGLTSSTTLTVTIHGVNDAPVAVNDSVSVAVDTVGGSPSTTANVLTNDVDADTGDTKLVSSISGGSIGTSIVGTYGTLTIQTNGSFVYNPDDSNAAVASLSPGSTLVETFTYQVTDSAGLSSSATLTLTLRNAGNIAPVLDASQSPVLASLPEDSASPTGVVGTLVSDLVVGISDVDSSALTGIAITAKNGTNGTLYYTTNAGSTWTDVGAVSESSALLLGADVNTRLYFMPSADYNGSVSDALTFRAWDQTSGAAGNKVSTTSNGVSTAFSTTTDTVAITVTTVNDTPVRSAGSLTAVSVTEDSANSSAQSLGLAGLTYGTGGGSDESAQTLTYTLTNIPSFVTLYKADGTTQVTTSTTGLTASDIAGLTYKTVANANGTGSITWTVTDNGTSNGSADAKTLTETLSITVKALPTLNISSVQVSELSSYAYFTASLSDSSSQAISFTPTLVSNTATVGIDTASTLEYFNGTSWISGSTFTIAAGQRSLSMRLAIVQDTNTEEGTESLVLRTGLVSGVANANGAESVITITEPISMGDTIVTDVADIANDPTPFDLLTAETFQVVQVTGPVHADFVYVYPRSSDGTTSDSINTNLYTTSEDLGNPGHYTLNFGSNALASGDYVVRTYKSGIFSNKSNSFTIDSTPGLYDITGMRQNITVGETHETQGSVGGMDQNRNPTYWNGTNWIDADGQITSFSFVGSSSNPTLSSEVKTLASGSSLTLDTRTGAYIYAPSISATTDKFIIYATDGAKGSNLSLTFDAKDTLDRDGIPSTVETRLSNLVSGTTTGDLNNDGIPDQNQNAVTTLAWTTVDQFQAGLDGSLLDVKPIISLVVMQSSSGSSVDSSSQLTDVKVLTPTDISVGGSKPSNATWDPIQFSIEPLQSMGLLDADPTRTGTQVRIDIDISRSEIKVGQFNKYMKYVSDAVIADYIAQGITLTDLDGNVVAHGGWFDFTQRTAGGDGARFILTDDGVYIKTIELIVTDNRFGDNNPTVGKVYDPGVPVYSNLQTPPNAVDPVMTNPLITIASRRDDSPTQLGDVILTSSNEIDVDGDELLKRNKEIATSYAGKEQFTKASTSVLTPISLKTLDVVVIKSPNESLADGTRADGVSNLKNTLTPPDAQVGIGGKVEYQIPQGTFTGGQGSIQLVATQKDGSPLPSWAKFDGATGKLTGIMPSSQTQAIEIKIQARDTKGDKAETVIKIKPKSDNISFIGKKSLQAQIEHAVRLRA